jgi:hypothetical protein
MTNGLKLNMTHGIVQALPPMVVRVVAKDERVFEEIVLEKS